MLSENHAVYSKRDGTMAHLTIDDRRQSTPRRDGLINVADRSTRQTDQRDGLSDVAGDKQDKLINVSD